MAAGMPPSIKYSNDVHTTDRFKSDQEISRHDDMEGAPLLESRPGTFQTVQIPDCPDPTTPSVGAFERLSTAVWESGNACVAGAAFLFSLTGALVKVINFGDHGVPVFQIVVIRSLISMILTLATEVARGTPMKSVYGQMRHWPLLGARGVVGAAAMTIFYESLIRLPLADAMTILFCNPAICSVFAWILLGEAFGVPTILGCLASMAGVALVARPPFLFGQASGGDEEWTRDRTVGMILAVTGAFVSSGAYLAIRYIGKREPPIVVAMWFHTTALVSNAIPLSFGYPNPAVLPGAVQSVCLVAIGFCSFTAQLLLNRGFQIQVAVKAAAVNYTQVIYAHIFGALLFKESISALGVLGAGLIAVGVLTVNADKKSGAQTQQHAPRMSHTGDEEGGSMVNGDREPCAAQSNRSLGTDEAGLQQLGSRRSSLEGSEGHRWKAPSPGPWIDHHGKPKLKSSKVQLHSMLDGKEAITVGQDSSGALGRNVTGRLG